jgi:OOP family OmpA-OmpF porin
LKNFRLGKDQVWVALQSRAYLAAIVRGEAPEDLRLAFQQTIERIHTEHDAALKDVFADPSVFESVRPEVSSLVRSEYGPIPERPRLPWLPRVWPAAIPLWPVVRALAVLGAIVLPLYGYRKWRGDGQNATSSVPIVRAAGGGKRAVSPSPEQSVSSRKGPAPSVASDSKKALARFEAAFPLPATVKVTVASGALVLTGIAPYEWISAVQEGALKIPGISGINGDDLVVEFAPGLVIQRFREQFGIPDTVEASFQNGRLFLTGEAPHSWLDQVRRGAKHVAGIQVIDDRRVVDTDQRNFQQAKAQIEETAILFVLNRDSLPEETAAKLGQTAAAVQRCLTAASNMEVNVSLEVRAYGDAVATAAENEALSRRRADAVKDLLVANGVDGKKINSLGMGTPPPPGPGERSGAGEFDRRVLLRMIIQP